MVSDTTFNLKNSIVFCKKTKYGQIDYFMQDGWLILVDSSVSQLEYYVKQNFEYLNALESLTLSFCKKVDKQVDYSHQIEETSFKFLLINQKLQKGFYESEVNLDDEIGKLIGQTSLRQLKMDVQVKSNEKKRQTGKEFTLFEKLIYYYTTDALYRQLNGLFAESSYESIEQIMCTLFDGYSKLQQKQLAQNTLFRGINIWDEKIFNEIMDQLKQCEKDKTSIFWNALTSTTIQKRCAENFMGNKQGILFEITLSKINPHPYFILESYHSRYSNEKEVLLFPQFQFKIVEIKTQGRNYYCRIQQIDNNLSMALNSSQREKYWQERINNELKPKLHTLASFQQIRINEMLSIQVKQQISQADQQFTFKQNSSNYFQSLVSQLQKFCDNQEVHINYLSKLLSLITTQIDFNDALNKEYLQESKILIKKCSERLINEFILLVKKIYNLENFKNDIQKLVQNRIEQVEIQSKQNQDKRDLNEELLQRQQFQTLTPSPQQEQKYKRRIGICFDSLDDSNDNYEYFDKCLSLSNKDLKSSGIRYSNIFNPEYNKRWNKYQTKAQRGPPYHRYDYKYPTECFGVGLDVRVYGQNQDWLKKDGNPNEWRILFHGTKSDNVSQIVKNGFQPGRFQFYRNDICQDEFGQTTKVDVGIYFADSIESALVYAPYERIWDKTYAVIIMVRANPRKIRQSQSMRREGYFLVNDSEDIRPYRILLHEKQ
ncbi:unnamed protein product [Paramecium octaurelia]|uniref:NAD(+)--protein-arginine ADP-ribosyltransferase n=1 Tax=Paramecium octaurelia TaxID=43137 RepID=A0A8S1VNY9_PAROT|nr:unnamed protein product [Paramecium octaurelia]